MPARASRLHPRPRERVRTARGRVVCYSFTAVDLHHLLLAGLPAHLPSLVFRTLTCSVLSELFHPTLTTTALYRSSSDWFETRS